MENENLKPIFFFFFLNRDILVYNKLPEIKFYTEVKNIHIEGTVSQFVI